MDDIAKEVTPRDVSIAHGAATLTDNLMREVGIPAGQRNQFAEKIGGTAVDASKRTVDLEDEIAALETDVVTGLSLNSVTRRNIAKRLQQGEKGTIFDFDLVGLKHLNSFSHKTGNSGLITMAEVLKQFGFAELGRKGDEFYAFAPGLDEAEARGKFTEFMRDMQAQGKLVEDNTKTNLLSYWSCAHVDSVNDLDRTIDALDSNVEAVKKQVAERILQFIDTQPGNHKAELMVLYFNHRVRAQQNELTQYERSLEERFRERYHIETPLSPTDELALSNISETIKREFHTLQEKALKEVNL